MSESLRATHCIVLLAGLIASLHGMAIPVGAQAQSETPQITESTKSPAANNNLLLDVSASETQAASYTLGTVTVTANNIFDKAKANAGSSLINRLHYVTRENVIRREVWMKPGGNISVADAREIERNLRDLDLFARVRVKLVPDTRNTGTANLQIETFDRLSIVASAGGSFLGGIGEVKFSLGDKNLLGLGHQLVFGYSENTEGELLGSIAYDNVLVRNPDVYTGVRLGQTEEGDFAEFVLQNRFQHYRDNLSWALRLDRQTTGTDFFEAGESVAEVPRTRTRLRSNRITRRGTGDQHFSFGPILNYTENRYGAPTGINAATIDVPEDDSRLFVGVLFGRDRISSYRKVTYLDTLGYEQDLTLGKNGELSVGLEHIEAETEEKTLPALFLQAWSHNALSRSNYLNLAIGSSLRVGDSEVDAWSISTATTAFHTRSRNHTIAARLFYESSFDRDGLLSQQTLGESNGLRGYPAREFNGEQKLLLNLEYRFRTPLSYASVEIGGLTFFDTGWVGERGSSDWLSEPRASLGAGIRIGSPQLLGSNIIRLDFAYPLDDNPLRDYSPTLSLAIGQVFGFRP